MDDETSAAAAAAAGNVPLVHRLRLSEALLANGGGADEAAAAAAASFSGVLSTSSSAAPSARQLLQPDNESSQASPSPFVDETPRELLGETTGIAVAMRQHTLRSSSSTLLARDLSPDVASTTIPLTHHNIVMLLHASRVVCAEINPKMTIGYILTEAKKLLRCGSCVLYIYDAVSNCLVPIIAEENSSSADSVSIPFRLAKSRKQVSILSREDIASEAYISGVTIRRCRGDTVPPVAGDNYCAGANGDEPYSVLTVPVWDTMEKVRAILKVMNKLSDDGRTYMPFSEEDELILRHFSLLAGVALRNAALYKDAVASRDLADGLLTLLSSLRPDLGVQSAILTLTTHAKKIMQVEHCTIYIIDRVSSHLMSMSSDSPDLTPMRQYFNEEEDESILGECARKGEPVILEYSDPGDHNLPSVEDDQKSEKSAARSPVVSTPHVCEFGVITMPSSVGRTPSSSHQHHHSGRLNVAVVPIRAENQMTIGLIELRNKKDEEGSLLSFTEEDMRVLEIFGRVVGPRLERSDLGLKATAHPPTEAGRASDNLPIERRRPSLVAPSIKEEDVEESESSATSTDEIGYRTSALSAATIASSNRRWPADVRKPSLLSQRLTSEVRDLRSVNNLSQSLSNSPVVGAESSPKVAWPQR